MRELTWVYPLCGEGVLLSKKVRGLGQGYLSGYAAEVEDGEPLASCAVGGLVEQAGLSATLCDLDLAGRIDLHLPNERYDCRVHLFRLHRFSGEPRASAGLADPRYYPFSSLPGDRVWPAGRDWFPRVLRGGRIDADLFIGEGCAFRIEYHEYGSRWVVYGRS